MLSGCVNQNNLDVSTVPVEKTKLNLQQIEQVEMKPVKWYIITPKNYPTVFKQLQSDNSEKVLIGLSADGYENLSLNMAELKKYLLLQKEQLKSYKEYYEK